MPRRAELTAIPIDTSLSHVLDKRLPVTNYCLANSGQRSWRHPSKYIPGESWWQLLQVRIWGTETLAFVIVFIPMHYNLS